MDPRRPSRAAVLVARLGAAALAAAAGACDSRTALRVATALLLVALPLCAQQKHLLGTTYRAGVLPSHTLDACSRCLMMTMMAALGATAFNTADQTPPLAQRLCRGTIGGISAVYALSYLDCAEATGERHVPSARYLQGWRPWLLAWFLSCGGRAPSVVAAAAEPLRSRRRYVLGMHPHGVMPFGALLNLGTSYTGRDDAIAADLPLLFCAATFCFYVPIMREIFLRWGVVDASRPFLSNHLANGHSVAVFPGGAAEARAACATGARCGAAARPPDGCADRSADLVLSCRRGFIELALEHGAHLVPIYTFGEVRSLGVKPTDVLRVGNLMKRLLGIWIPLVGIWMPCRRRCACTTVVGEPIVPFSTADEMPTGAADRAAAPDGRRYTEADVDNLHARYTAALQALYAAHVGKYGEPNAPTKITLVA